MKNFKISFAFVAVMFMALIFASCTKEGFDGDSTITGKVAHHGERISEASVFIKFGGKELPGTLTSDFDASVVADTSGTYTFSNLKKGDYYLYGVGFDSTINESVRGGIAVTLEKDQVLTQEVAVTE
jgi:hypothetical protein